MMNWNHFLLFSCCILLITTTGWIGSSEGVRAKAGTGGPFRTTATGGIIDAAGRWRIFHGTNFVLKGWPWYPWVLLNSSNVQQYAEEWGMTSLRLGTMWTGAQPQEQGSFNESYYQQLQHIVSNLAEQGVYAILDCHQDVLSSFFCEYDGAPQWLVNRSLVGDAEVAQHPFPEPLPNASGCYGRPWAENYLARATGRAFQDIYSDRHGNRQALAQFWQQTASRFAAFEEGVLGYEFFNEPWCGDYFDDPALLLPGVAGRLNLQPLYDHLAAAISSVDSQHLFFFEPVTWSILFNSQLVGTGFTKTPGNQPQRSVLSWHYYCWFFSPQHAERLLCDRAMGPDAFRAIGQDARQLGTAGFLTEWGLCDPSTASGLNECRHVMALADQHLMSWTNWDWGAGQLQYGWIVNQSWVAAMVRPYVRAFAGVPLTMSFDPDSLAFFANFTVDATIAAPTELFVPPLHYPAGSFAISTVGLAQTPSAFVNIVAFVPLPGATIASISITSSLNQNKLD